MNHPTQAHRFIIKHAAVTLALALLLPAVAAQAADAERMQDMAAKLQERFKAADADGDGKLTKDEAKAKMPFVYKHFDEIDTAHTGAVTMADIGAYAKAQQGNRKAAK